MKTAAEYRRNAEECRKLAKRVSSPEDKETLEELAKAWDKLAESDLDPDDA